jgi:hypothetical protein
MLKMDLFSDMSKSEKLGTQFLEAAQSEADFEL